MTSKFNEWRAWGDRDAYYGVLSGPEYRKDQLTPARLDNFFASGEKHIRYILARIAHHFGETPRGKALDYGCGVGRLVFPLSHQYQQTYGIDLSEGMLAEARKVAKERGAVSTIFVQSDGGDLSGLPSDFDLIHSLIVFQHIPIEHGYFIMDKLMGRIAPGGILAIHVNINRKVGRLHKILSSARRLWPLHVLANVVTGKPALEPRMQMNCYSLDKIATMMAKHGLEAMIAEPYSDYQGYVAFLIFGRRKA